MEAGWHSSSTLQTSSWPARPRLWSLVLHFCHRHVPFPQCHLLVSVGSSQGELRLQVLARNMGAKNMGARNMGLWLQVQALVSLASQYCRRGLLTKLL